MDSVKTVQTHKLGWPQASRSYTIETAVLARVVNVEMKPHGGGLCVMVEEEVPSTDREERAFTVINDGGLVGSRAVYVGSCHVDQYQFHVFETTAR